jgi:DNA polymerase-3 subunit delta'
MAFKDVSGNSRVKKILIKALQKSRVPNSLLFCGPEGVGKRETALVLAKALNCQKKKDDACEACISCKAVNAGNFPDVIEIQAEGNFLKIEQMRLIKDIVYRKPMIGKRRVFIVAEAEKMTEEAANSLLKILEEPPLFSYIILLTDNPFLILPTIKSRCQILNFLPISKEDIEKILVDKGFETEKARVLSLIVRGNLKQALSLEWEEVEERRRLAWQLFLSLLGKENLAQFLRPFTSSHRSFFREEWEQLLEILSSFCRDLILVKENSQERLLMNPDYEEEIRKAEKQVSPKHLQELLAKIDYSMYGLQKNFNLSLLVSSFFLDFKDGEYV